MCGTPLVIADNVGSAEAVAQGGKIEFSRTTPGSFEHAIQAAIEQVRAGHARLERPLENLVYDPGVDAHVAALYRLMSAV